MAAVLSALLVLVLASPADADWICDGDRLSIDYVSGPVDNRGLPNGIPNTASGTLPGDGIVLRWRDITLQLPRTNNAGTPSYTDGRWWWREEDHQHPEFRQRRGGVTTYSCEPSSETVDWAS